MAGPETLTAVRPSAYFWINEGEDCSYDSIDGVGWDLCGVRVLLFVAGGCGRR